MNGLWELIQNPFFLDLGRVTALFGIDFNLASLRWILWRCLYGAWTVSSIFQLKISQLNQEWCAGYCVFLVASAGLFSIFPVGS